MTLWEMSSEIYIYIYLSISHENNPLIFLKVFNEQTCHMCFTVFCCTVSSFLCYGYHGFQCLQCGHWAWRWSASTSVYPPFRAFWFSPVIVSFLRIICFPILFIVFWLVFSLSSPLPTFSPFLYRYQYYNKKITHALFIEPFYSHCKYYS